jgi:hypothetical protein
VKKGGRPLRKGLVGEEGETAGTERYFASDILFYIAL